MLENELYQKIDLLRKCKNVRELSKNVKKFRNFQKPHRICPSQIHCCYVIVIERI